MKKNLGDIRKIRSYRRRQQIVTAVTDEGNIKIHDLAHRFKISLMTVHRDLDILSRQGILHKNRGMASTRSTSYIESNDIYRSKIQLYEKQDIALSAINYIKTGQVVFLDESTSALHLVPYIHTKAPLTVITNSLTMINKLKDIEGITIIGLGGQFFNWCNAFVGRLTIDEIAKLRADTLIMSMSSIIDGMAFHQYQEIVDTKHAMFESSEKRILLVDHTKFTTRALFRFKQLNEFDAVIVDNKISKNQVKSMCDNGVSVIIADKLVT